MIDFVRILKKTINAQSYATPRVREQIYQRALETLEHKFLTATIPQSIADEQKQNLQSAIKIIEEEYSAAEKELFFSKIGWKSNSEAEGGKNSQNSALQPKDNLSSVAIEKRQELSLINLKDNQKSRKSSTLTLPNAEPVNIDTHGDSPYIKEHAFKNSNSISASQADNSHVVSHIFTQALRRANRSSMKKRVIIGTIALASFIILIVGICFVCERLFVLNHHQLSGKNIQDSNMLQEEFLINRKLTQRLLEDGSEIDVGSKQMADSLNNRKISTVVSADSQSIEEQLGEAIFYQTRTDYDAEKVATGSARWSLIKEVRGKGEAEESAIQGDITIPDEGLSLRLILRRNTDLSFPAAYIMDLIFILSDKFSGQAISNVQAVTFKASEQSIGQPLKRTVSAKIDDDFFLVALSGNHPFLNQNLQLMRELDWIRLVLTDKNGRINELTFAKGPIGEAIFDEVIGRWLTTPNRLTVLDQKKGLNDG
ncbi:hypothetical protein [Bartonella sp. B30(2025)]